MILGTRAIWNKIKLNFHKTFRKKNFFLLSKLKKKFIKFFRKNIKILLVWKKYELYVLLFFNYVSSIVFIRNNI